MTTPPIIERFRQIIGEKTDTGYVLSVDESLEVPNSLDVGGKFELPEITIRPFIIDTLVGEDDNIIGEQRVKTEFYHSRFQVDIYSKTLSELLKIRDAMYDRIDDFKNIELMEYSGDWEEVLDGENPTGIYSIDPVDDEKIASVVEDCQDLIEVTSLEEMIAGTWLSNETGFYVFPFVDIDNILLCEIFNGLLFENGHTAYRDGIRNIRIIMAWRTKDADPDTEKWLSDYLITYQRTRVLNQGEIVEEGDLDLNVTKN